MTVLFFTRLFYPHIGGVEKHVWKISKRLIEQSHKVIIVTEQYDKKLKLKESYKTLQIYRIPVGKNERLKKFEIWRWLSRHRKLIQTSDIIHCHDVFFWYLPFRFLYPSKKVFTTFHGYESYPIRKRAIIIRKISELLSHRNICIGAFIKKWYKTNPAYVIYGGVDHKNIKNFPTNFIRAGSRMETIIGTNQELKIVFVGRLDEQTGILRYLDALRLLKKIKINVELNAFGDGNLRKTAEEFSKMHKLNAYFKGFVPGSEIDFAEYNYVFASRYLSVLEAFAAKRLAVAVYDNAIKEDYLRLTPFAKYMVIVSSANQVVSKLRYYLNHPKEEKELVEKAHKWVENQTWDNVVKTYLELWSDFK